MSRTAVTDECEAVRCDYPAAATLRKDAPHSTRRTRACRVHAEEAEADLRRYAENRPELLDGLSVEWDQPAWRIARWHFESRRARWWRELKGWAWLVWHQGWGAVWFWSRWETASDETVRPLHLGMADDEYLALRRWNRDRILAAFVPPRRI